MKRVVLRYPSAGFRPLYLMKLGVNEYDIGKVVGADAGSKEPRNTLRKILDLS